MEGELAEPALAGQVALVTGCSRATGIGRSIALALARAGADVAVTARPEASSGSPGELAMVADEVAAIGRRSLAVRGDVGLRSDAERMVSEVVAELGAVDVLVNNAAAPHGADRVLTWEVPEDAFDDVMRVNSKGVFLMSGAVVRHLLGRRAPGRIINIGSGVARRGVAGRAVYSASKAAVVGLSQAMANELGPHRITVNVVNPGFIQTGRIDPAGFARVQDASRRGGLGLAVPADRMGSPEDVARMVVFLAEPSADFVTGQAFNVDGGLMMS